MQYFALEGQLLALFSEIVDVRGVLPSIVTARERLRQKGFTRPGFSAKTKDLLPYHQRPDSRGPTLGDREEQPSSPAGQHGAIRERLILSYQE